MNQIFLGPAEDGEDSEWCHECQAPGEKCLEDENCATAFGEITG